MPCLNRPNLTDDKTAAAAAARTVRQGALCSLHLIRRSNRPSDGLIGRVGNSGNSDAPHLHFQVMDAPSLSFTDATGLPFVFDTQLLEGTVPTPDSAQALQAFAQDWLGGAPLPVDRAGAGVVRSGQMPARNGVFGYNLSSQ